MPALFQLRLVHRAHAQGEGVYCTVPGNQGERERVLKLHITVYIEIAGATWPARKL